MTSDTTSDDPEISLGGRHGRKAGRSDDGKPIMHTMDPDFILGIGRVSAFGAKKYSARNFLISPGMEWSRVFDSALRHLFAFWAGEELDEESQLPHLLMASWNLMALYTYSRHTPYAVGDDRPSTLEYDEGNWRDWRAEFELAQQDAAKPAPDPVHRHDGEALAAPARTRSWRHKVFGYWLPVRLHDGSWGIVMEQMCKPPLRFYDYDDEKHGYKMDEDEALDRARALNAINWDGATNGLWYSRSFTTAEPEVKQPAFMKDPLRQGLAEQTKGDK